MKTIYCLLLLGFNMSLMAQDSAAVYFPFDKAFLTEEAKQQLNEFITEYKSGNQGQPLVIKGYCDVIGSHPYNDRLSENRTLSVQRYLVANGIPASAISLRKGYGK